jgi:hypothetical protein
VRKHGRKRQSAHHPKANAEASSKHPFSSAEKADTLIVAYGDLLKHNVGKADEKNKKGGSRC